MPVIDHVIGIGSSIILSTCFGYLLLFVVEVIDFSKAHNKKINDRNRRIKWHRIFKELE